MTVDPYLTQKRYRIRRARHGGNLRIDVAPYREQLLTWREQGWSYPAIAQAVGVDVSTIQRISGNDSSCANRYVRREVARAIDEADFGRCHGTVWIPVIGAQRRLQALAAIGWTVTAIVDQTGIPRGTINSIRTSASQITAATHQRLAAAYERLSAYPQDGTSALRARSHAHRQGWAPPAAWDNIDNPDEHPTGIRHATPAPTHAPNTATRSRVAAADLIDLIEHGCDLADVTSRFDATAETVYQALRRAGRTDLWDRIRAPRKGGVQHAA